MERSFDGSGGFDYPWWEHPFWAISLLALGVLIGYGYRVHLEQGLLRREGQVFLFLIFCAPVHYATDG